MDKQNNIGELIIEGPHVSLSDLCGRVIALDAAYDDVAEQIEDLAYCNCEHGTEGGIEGVVSRLSGVASFFEGMRNKNEEIVRDLAQVYLLVGQIYQYAGRFEESIEWFDKSAVVDDMNPVVYHSLALSYQGLGDIDLAVKALEQEIRIAPGNYYTYLFLADLYDGLGRLGAAEDVLKRLLERSPDNIQGLHNLIRLYERTSPNLDVTLLRRRLLNRDNGLNRIEAVIRAYHLCATDCPQEALDFLAGWSISSPDAPIVHLANAHIYYMTRQYSKNRRELSVFKGKCHGRKEVIEVNLMAFASVFGEREADALRYRLRIVHPVSAG